VNFISKRWPGLKTNYKYIRPILNKKLHRFLSVIITIFELMCEM